jgi:DNA-binding MarR family transcriptional regulator
VPSARARPSRPPLAVDYAALADLRYQLRRFLRVREVVARAAQIEPQQYLLLLHVKGMEGREAATIRALAERLQIQHHGVVQLVDRLAARRMVERHRGERDRRHVVVGLLPKGEKVLARLASQSVAELKTEGPALVSSLKRLLTKSKRFGTSPRRGRTEDR